MSAPKASSATVSAQMRRMGRRDTAPELAVRKALTARGLRYRLHRRDLPGTPDIVFVAARVAVFVDGCFWHGCPDHGALPRVNREWWRSKLAENCRRDNEKDKALAKTGWLSVHVWEHEDPATAAAAVHDLILRRLRSRASADSPPPVP